MIRTTNTQSTSCTSHPKESLNFVCFDQECSSPDIYGCFICIKSFHSKCCNDLIVEVEELTRKVAIQRTEVDSNHIQEIIGTFLNEQALLARQRLEATKSKHLADLKVHQHWPSGNLSHLPRSKLNFDIELDQRARMLKISSKTAECVKDMGYSLNLFKQQIAAQYALFKQDLNRLNFSLKSQLLKEEWLTHSAISITEVDNGLKFSRNSDNSQLNYFCAVRSLPLNDDITFKITILSVNSSDRYIDIGIAGSNKYKDISQSLLNTFSSGGISYCGYSISGLTGKSLTNSSNSEDGFKPGEVFYLNFEPKRLLTFYNDSMTIDLKSTELETTQDEYYLFAVLYHPEASFQIEIA